MIGSRTASRLTDQRALVGSKVLVVDRIGLAVLGKILHSMVSMVHEF